MSFFKLKKKKKSMQEVNSASVCGQNRRRLGWLKKSG